MSLSALSSTAIPERARLRLTSPWALLGLAVAVVVALVLVFPRQRLIEQTAQEPADALNVNYLKNLLRTDPENSELRLTLAGKQVELGNFDDAIFALGFIYKSGDAAARRRAKWLDFQIQLKKVEALPADASGRRREDARLREQFEAVIADETKTPQLIELAELALRLGLRDISAGLYQRIAAGGSEVSLEWLEASARVVLGDGNYPLAATLYFTAQNRAHALEDQRRYLLAGLRTLQSGNLLREALAAADRQAAGFEGDDATLLFLIQLARAANDLPRAERYVKKLLRMSDRVPAPPWLRSLANWLVASAVAAESARQSVPPAGMRPFDDANYKLAYEIFLANRNLHDAYRVADAAVQQAPHDLTWRERLAQVAEWDGKPAVALQQWLHIARLSNRPEAWQTVLRIAPGANDDAALLLAQQYFAERGDPGDAQWRAIVDAYERMGQPREGVAYLERQYARRPRTVLLESIAMLLDRSGDLAAAVAGYRRLIEKEGATTPRVAKLASLLILSGDFRVAYNLLDRHRARVAAEDAAYWKLLGDLAWQLQDDAGAQSGYRALADSGKAAAEDIARLVMLLRPRQPELAASAAEAAYARFGQSRFMLLALDIHTQQRDRAALRRIFSALSAVTEQSLAGEGNFLLMRAEFHVATGSHELALADYRRALAQDPANTSARIAILWIMIDRKQLAPLRREVAAAMARGKDDAAYDGVFAAAWLTLKEPVRALAYFSRQLAQNRDDYLWLLNYADALEHGGQGGMAWRVRRHAWTTVRRAVAGAGRAAPQALLEAHARLAIQFEPGDAGLVVVRNLLRQDRSSGTAEPAAGRTRDGLNAATSELILSWALSNEQTAAARAWLWNQYGRNLAKPLWAEVSVALAENDMDTLERVLAGASDGISPADRVELARRTQQIELAQSLAFAALEAKPDDDVLHLQLSDAILVTAHQMEAGQTQFQRGVLEGRDRTAGVHVWLTPRLRLSLTMRSIDQNTSHTTVLTGVPGHDRQFTVAALLQHAEGRTEIGVYQREAMASLTGLRATHQRRFGQRLRARVGLATNERSLETTLLAVAGMKDQADIGIDYALSRREYLRGELFGARYYTQGSTSIGSGRGLNWELGHRIRTEYPDFAVRLAGSVHRYAASGAGDGLTALLNPAGTIPGARFFLPQDFAVYGMYAGFGASAREVYTRALRPYAEFGITRNTVSGTGYSGIVGIAGSVLGPDRLSFHAQQARGGNGTNDSIREIGVRYQYFFDRF